MDPSGDLDKPFNMLRSKSIFQLIVLLHQNLYTFINFKVLECSIIMKKNILLPSMVLCASLLLVGCDNSNNSTDATEGVAQPQTTVETTSPQTVAPATQDKELQFGKVYDVENAVSFIKLKGFSSDEPAPGVWTDATKATFTLYVDKKTLSAHPTGNIKFMVGPFLGPNLDTQHSIFHWGKGHEKKLAVTANQWISLPYILGDWKDASTKNHHLKKISIHVNLPNATSPQQLGVSSDSRLLGLRFMQFSLSN